MNFKKVLFPIISFVLAKFSYDTLVLILKFSSEKFGIGLSFFLALIVNALVVGVFAFLGFAYATNKILPKSYYYITNRKQLKFWYNALGVKYFRNFLMLAFWGKEKNREKYFDGTRSGLDNLIYQSKQSEFGHLIAFVLMLVISGIFLYKGYCYLGLFSLVLNFIGNIYPVLLQRHHRIRIDGLSKYLNRRSSTN